MRHTVSARQIQREYKKVLERANKLGQPLIVISHNKPLGAIIGLDLLEHMQLDLAAKEALNEYKAGKTTSISSEEDLENYLKEVEP